MPHDRSRPFLAPAHAPQRRELYPSIEPYHAEMLPVDGRHTLYLEQSGSPDGLPVLCLHGGPGGGASPEMRRFFDPTRYRIILFDQRGCGRSTPHATIEDNTTWDLVADIEKIRERAGVERFLVFGGSWGSTLALAYAVTHPEHCLGLLLRGIFLLTEAEIRWFYQEGASHIYPDAFERFCAPIPIAERHDFVGAFYKRLTSASRAERITAARAWGRWEGETISFAGPSAMPSRFNDDRFVEAFARIECHYFHHRGFFPRDGYLLEQASRYRHLPGVIVHGRYDVCTPMSSAWKLKQAWPEAELEVVGDAGHSSLESGIVDALVRAADRLAHKGPWR
jgi:proline iminopeptidase